MLGHRNVIFTYAKYCQVIFQKKIVLFHSPNVRFCFSTFSPTLVIVKLHIAFVHLVDVKCYLLMVLICIFLITI